MRKEMPDNNSENPKSKRIGIIVSLFSLIILLVILGLRLFSDDKSMLKMGEAPEDFSLITFSGERIQTSDLRGKIVLVNFWASWCVTCDDEAIMLERAWQELQNKAPGEAVFLGVAYMDTEPAARSFLQEYGVTYPNGPDLRSEISNLYQVQGVPETFILDQEGILRSIKYGPFLSVEEILSLINPLLSGQGAE
jgi:cytochrome c biogenesis protein CcmG/thiol:disulfide interchange protein DsbE